MAEYQQGVPIRINDTFRVAGVETNPTTVVYTILAPDGTVTTYSWPGAPEIANLSAGVFQLSLGAPSLPGFYSYDVDSTGTVIASRSGSFTILANVATDVDVAWAVGGPCAPWVSSQDVWECCGQPNTTINGDVCPVDFSAYALAASNILFELSGRRFSGYCTKTVRPCRQDCFCGFQVLSRGYVVAPPYYYWTGSWWNCGDDMCGCQPLSRVKLSGYPVREIIEVLIDGAVVNPTTYRLDGWRWLTRMRDTADPGTALFWPSCQILDLPATQPGTFSVEYAYGQDPPLEGTLGAAALACQLYNACSGGVGDCEIPANAVRVTRQGVTIDRNATIAWFYGKNDESGWNTGIPSVDAFLNSSNPTGMIQRPRTWSPDGSKFAKVLGT